MTPLVALALQYAREHDEEIVTYAYTKLKELVEAKLEERRKARASIAADQGQLEAARKAVDADLEP